MSFRAELERMGACKDGIEWAGDRTLAEIWRDCERGDWMLWLATRVGVEHKLVVMAACAYARLVLHAVPEGEDRPRIAVETAERWCRGEATAHEVDAAARSAASAAWEVADAAARSAASAAWAAAWAAAPAAARAAAWSAADAAAWEVADAAARAVAEVVGHRATADAVRSVITAEMIEQAWRKE